MKTPINKNSVIKAKTVVSDKEFRNHFKNSAKSAVKAGSRARSVTRNKKKCRGKKAAVAISAVFAVGAVGLLIKSATTKNK